MNRVTYTIVAALLLVAAACSNAPDATEAGVYCQVAVKERLVSPGSARFPIVSDTQITQTGDTFRVLGWVDSQNGFGAMLRSNYDCTVEIPGDGTWILKRLDLEEG
jgi:hypothetical protein